MYAGLYQRFAETNGKSMNEMLADFLTIGLATVGVVFMLISALGALRLPDIFTRMHANGKTSTLGVSCLLLSAGLFFQDNALLWRMVALIALYFITAPIAATAMARAAYRTGNPENFKLSVDHMADKKSEG